jgi:hypothetical protein
LAVQLATIGNPLPFLQDTTADQVWSHWGVAYRDFRILDSSNRLVAVYNLTEHDLTVPANFNELEEMLVAAANAGDSDGDGLPDAWEEHFLHGTNQGPNDDPDGDRSNNQAEFAFGSDPLDANSHPLLETGWNSSNQFTVSFNRCAGTAFEYFVDMSTNLVRWSSGSTSIRSGITNLFDGTGRSRATYNLVRSADAQPSAFVRVDAEAKP